MSSVWPMPDPYQRPQWSPTDEQTGSLLDLIADDGTLTTEHEWECYLSCLRTAAACGVPDNTIDPNFLRVAIDGRIKPQRVGAFCRRAQLEGLIVAAGWVTCKGSNSGNDGRPARSYRWVGGASR